MQLLCARGVAALLSLCLIAAIAPVCASILPFDEDPNVFDAAADTSTARIRASFNAAVAMLVQYTPGVTTPTDAEVLGTAVSNLYTTTMIQQPTGVTTITATPLSASVTNTTTTTSQSASVTNTTTTASQSTRSTTSTTTATPQQPTSTTVPLRLPSFFAPTANAANGAFTPFTFSQLIAAAFNGTLWGSEALRDKALRSVMLLDYCVIPASMVPSTQAQWGALMTNISNICAVAAYNKQMQPTWTAATAQAGASAIEWYVLVRFAMNGADSTTYAPIFDTNVLQTFLLTTPDNTLCFNTVPLDSSGFDTPVEPGSGIPPSTINTIVNYVSNNTAAQVVIAFLLIAVIGLAVACCVWKIVTSRRKDAELRAHMASTLTATGGNSLDPRRVPMRQSPLSRLEAYHVAGAQHTDDSSTELGTLSGTRTASTLMSARPGFDVVVPSEEKLAAVRSER